MSLTVPAEGRGRGWGKGWGVRKGGGEEGGGVVSTDLQLGW